MSNRIACAGSHWKRNITVVCALLIGGNGASGADTVIYGANAYGLANIHEINLSSGQSQWAANLAFETQAIDLDPVTGNVYYFDWTVSANKFAYWNPTTGLSTIVRTYSPTAGVYPKHMAFAPDNTLYVLDNSDLLYTINKLNGDISLVGQVTGLETGSKDRTGDFAFAPDGTFYVATYQSLYRLDLGTLHATLLYSGLLQEIGGFNVWAGLAYCDGVLYAANVRDGPPRSAIFSIDPLTGAVNELFSLPTFVNDLSSCPSSGLLNHPPELAAIGNKTVMEGESIEFGVAALDADGDDLTYTVRDLPPGASFNPETQIFSWVPGTHDIGDHAIDFVVTDNGVPQRSDTEKVIVSVDTLATVESVTITGQTTTEDSSIANLGYASTNFGGSSVNLAVGSFGNGIAARALLKWDLSSIPAGSVIVNAEMSLYSYNDGGNKRIAIKAHRLLRPWVEGTLDGQDRQLDNPDSVCWTESGSGLSWQAGGASGSGDRSLSSITMTTNSGVGRYTWNITSAVQNWVNGNWANDGILLESLNENLANIKYFNASEVQTSSRRPQLIVDYVVAPVANQAPVLDPIGDRTVGEQENLSFAVTASDPDQDNLSFGADVLPAGATLDPTSGAFNWTPSVGQAGSYPILFTVSDDGVPVLSDSEQVTITVTAPVANQAPVLDPIGDRTVGEQENLSFAAQCGRG